MENKSRKKGITIALAVVLLANVSNMMRSSSLANVRTVDALQLIACGMLIGALIANLIINRRINKE